MDQKSKYENLSGTRNPLINSSSEHHFNQDNLLSSRIGESLPAMNTNHQQITSIQSNLSRFPDDLTNLYDENSNQIEKSKEEKERGRWDDAWDEHEKEQQQQQEKEEIKEILIKNENINEHIEIPSFRPTNSLSNNITRIYVREFHPKSNRDPILSILRNIFVRSFDDFYKKIETQLNLNSDTNLIQWLDKTFDEEQELILTKTYRCFLLCGIENQESNEIILGFLTLKEEEEGSIYIAQVAVRLDLKRRGFGGQLLQHLRSIYPSNTLYWGLCRRSNWPALRFYLKLGAKYMENDTVAKKYGYNPDLYAGFEFVDTIPIIASPGTLARMKPNTDDLDQQITQITDASRNNPNSSLIDVDQHIPKAIKPKKVVGCCIIS